MNKDENKKLDLELNLYKFFYFNYRKRKQKNNLKFFKYGLNKLNDQNIIEIISLTTEISRKRHLKHS